MLRALTLLLVIELALVLANYQPGTWLLGWDNILPELDFKTNFTRSLSAVWETHRGLGHYDGMAHAVNLVHTAILWLGHWVLPVSTLRYALTFLFHLGGGMGMYCLVYLLTKRKLPATLAGIFYLLNLLTLQMFYTPLEAFSVHFAALPWIAWGIHSKKYWSLVAIFILTTPQFFVGTLLLPVAILMVWLRASWKIWLTFIAINAFWLLPFLVGGLRNAATIANSKINLMSSPVLYAQHQAYADIKNLLLLRGLTLDFRDQARYVMQPWRDHLFTAPVTIIAFLLTTIILAKGRKYSLLAVVMMLILGTSIIQKLFPFLTEALRLPFTKFSLLLGFTLSVALGIGTANACKKLIFIFLLAILYVAWPAFMGNFFYDKLRVRLPQSYLQLFAYLQTQPPTGRIAMLPAPEFWSWKHYNFGYVGSGFAWYGIPQPTLDRAFDPWSRYNENFYWELSRAIYSKNHQLFQSVLTKYQVDRLLLDENLQVAGNAYQLYIPQIQALIGQNPDWQVEKALPNLTLYRRALTIAATYNYSDYDPNGSLFTKRQPITALPAGAQLITQIAKDQRLTARYNRSVVNFDVPDLPHDKAYAVQITSRHISGRPLLAAVINSTAHHVESEVYLPENTDWQSSTFILPPLAPDGLGYTFYFTNDSPNFTETINDLGVIKIYTFSPDSTPQTVAQGKLIYKHSQAYDTGWMALTRQSKILPHVLVDNWANGWLVDYPNQPLFIFFWPQLLQYLGWLGATIILWPKLHSL